MAFGKKKQPGRHEKPKMVKCNACNGSGWIIVVKGKDRQRYDKKCPTCKGKKEIPASKLG